MGISGDMGYRNDVGEIKGIQFTVGQNLPPRAIDHEHLLVHRIEKLHGLIDEGWIFPQEKDVQIGDIFEDQFIFFETVYQASPVLFHGHIGWHGDIPHPGHHFILPDIYIMGL